MQKATITVRYTRPGTDREEQDLLMLEQEEWDAYTGLLTRGQFARYLKDMILGREGEPRDYVDCGWGSAMRLIIHAYPLKPGVQFVVNATPDAPLSGPVWEEIGMTQTVTFSLETEADLKWPAFALAKAEWVSGPYGTGGVPVAAPMLVVAGRRIIAPFPVFGAVQVEIMVRRAVYRLDLPRDAAIPLLQAGWSEFAVGLPVGGRPVALELDEPPGAEEQAEKGKPCGRGGNGRTKDDDDDPPTASPANKLVKCHYCELECDDEGK